MPSRCSVKFIWFDLGYTLLYKQREEPYRTVLAEMGFDVRLDSLEREYHIVDKFFMREYPGVFGRDPDTFMPWFLGHLNYRLGVRADLAAMWARLKRQQNGGAASWVPFANARTTLAELGRRGIRLGVISNWDRSARPILERHGLSGSFEQIVISSEVGCEKPDPAIFKLAMHSAGVEPQECLYVGDNFYVDAVGARGAGMKCLIVNRFGRVGVEEIAEPIIIGDVSEVAGYLG
jgi:putative hydrolase of the HAD superfamily